MVFAHCHASKNYGIVYHEREMCEIVYIEKGGIIKTSGTGEQIAIQTPCVIFVPYNYSLSLKSEGEHRHFTVGFTRLTQQETAI